jgi:SPP1 family predicted phage head-tail adaptor
MDKRATVLRRGVLPAQRAGQALGDFAPVFTRWAALKWNSARLANEAGQAQPFDDVELVVRIDSQTRTITNQDRISLDGVTYAIEGHPVVYRLKGRIYIRLTSRLGG